MALEIIRTIKQVEEKAEEIRKKALTDAKDELKRNDRQNEEHFEEKVAEARKKALEIQAGYAADAEAEQQKMKADMDLQTGLLKENAQKNMNAAVEFIFGGLG
ncbi:MAG: hypothetical protein AAGU74_07515 [Bacillota bacterium]